MGFISHFYPQEGGRGGKREASLVEGCPSEALPDSGNARRLEKTQIIRYQRMPLKMGHKH